VFAVSLAIDWNRLGEGVATGLLWALVIIVGVRLALTWTSRRWPSLRQLLHAARIPFRVLVVLLALRPAVAVLRRQGAEIAWWDWAEQLVRLLLVLSIGWFVTTVALFVEDARLRRYRIDEPDNRVARRLRTQTLVLRRLTVSAGVVVTLGAALLSFPQVRLVGASLLASAGVIGIVAGLAAQSVLGNLFAGVQLAFSDARRTSPPRRSRTGRGRSPSCSARSRSTSTGGSTPPRCVASWTSPSSAPSCGTAG
jgi:small-conductance mechanosensitive channel